MIQNFWNTWWTFDGTISLHKATQKTQVCKIPVNIQVTIIFSQHIQIQKAPSILWYR